MRFRYSAAPLAALLFPALAFAQAPRPAVSLGGGARMYEEKSMVMASIRAEYPLPNGMVVEFAGSVADPVPETPRSTASVLEVQVQLPVPLGPTLTPYVGVGAGLGKIYTGDDGDGQSLSVISAGAGVKLAFSYNLGLVADARVRGIGAELDGRHVDVTVGLRYQFGRPDRPRFRGAPR